MELYNVPRNRRIKVIVHPIIPPSAPQFTKYAELNFSHVDGMYSYCTRDSGEVVHLSAWTEVEVINNKKG